MKQIRSSREIGYIVRARRRDMGITQKELAQRAGVSERLIIALELGDATGIRLDKLLNVLVPLGLCLSVSGGLDDTSPAPQSVDYAYVGLPDIDLELPPALVFMSRKGQK